MRVDDGQYAKLVAKVQLVMSEVHRADIIRADGFGTVIAQLIFHPPHRRLVPTSDA